MSRIRIGISGWRYKPWRGVFYPAGLVQRKELAFASATFDSIELNGSFYALQRPESYLRWYEETPRGFVFAVKAPRFITHTLRLRDVETAMANFFASGLLGLREKLGPILWQLPPTLRYDEAILETFLGQLPRDSAAAEKLAGKHDRHVDNAPVQVYRNRKIRHALEIRHSSFVTDIFIEQLRRHRVALVVADTAARWPLLEDVTADFMYLRLHGDKRLYESGYGEKALHDWARRILAWERGTEPKGARRCSRQKPRKLLHRDVYCYFDNDVKVRAPVDAARLRALAAKSR